MSHNLITVNVKLFAAFQDAFGVPELTLDFPENTPVSSVLERLLTEKKQLENWRNLTRFGVNLHFVDSSTILHDGDEVVLIPPVSGG